MQKAKMLSLVAGVFAMVTLPFASFAADSVKLESHLNVANVTAGDTKYVKSVNAKVDEVVKVELYIHNTELPTSGKVANNVQAKIAIPGVAGNVQTLSSSASADNAAAVTDTATVNLSLDNAQLVYVPGTASWTHNVGDNTNVKYQTEKISDNVVTTGVNLGNQQPCYNFEQYVTVQVRVVAPVMSINKTVKVLGSDQKFTTANSANPGDTLQYAIVVKNQGNVALKNVVIGDNLPPYLTYVKGTTKLVDSNTGIAGKILVDGVTTGGVRVDDLAVGASETIFLNSTIDKSLPCGTNHVLQNVGITKADNVPAVQNFASTTVNVAACKPVTPVTPVTPITPVTPKTPTTPPTPMLPATGAEAGLAGLGGLSAIAYAGRAYIGSKKSLLGALRK